jgi:hypothetical protein
MQRARIANRVATDKERRKDDRKLSSKMHTKPYDDWLPRFLGHSESLRKRKTGRPGGRTPTRMHAAGGCSERSVHNSNYARPTRSKETGQRPETPARIPTVKRGANHGQRLENLTTEPTADNLPNVNVEPSTIDGSLLAFVAGN